MNEYEKEAFTVNKFRVSNYVFNVYLRRDIGGCRVRNSYKLHMH